QAALQDHAQQSEKRVNVANLLRSECFPVPDISPLREQRETGHEHGERESESEKLPEQWSEARFTEIPNIVSPIEYRELTRSGVVRRRWGNRRQEKVSGHNTGERESRGHEDRVLIAEFR